MVANPEYNPSGVGDCIDTNKLPWIPVPNASSRNLTVLTDHHTLGIDSDRFQQMIIAPTGHFRRAANMT